MRSSSDPRSSTPCFVAGAVLVVASVAVLVSIVVGSAAAGAAGLPWTSLVLPLVVFGVGDAAMLYGYTLRMPDRS